MSDSRSSKMSLRSNSSWHRWQMNELSAPAPSPLPGKGSVRPARETSPDELRAQVRQQARDEGYRAGFAQGQEEGRQAGFDEAYEQGLSEGREEGRRQAEQELDQQIQQTLAPLGSLVQQADEALQALDEDIAAGLVDLALSVGRQLAREALDAKPEQILHVVRELLHSEPALNGKPRLWLHPEDLGLVETHLGSEFEAANWKLQPDDEITRGGCRITSGSGEIDATWEARWQAITRQVRKRRPPGARTSSRKAGSPNSGEESES